MPAPPPAVTSRPATPRAWGGAVAALLLVAALAFGLAAYQDPALHGAVVRLLTLCAGVGL